jgi:peroxiredoxin/N-acetylglutamate synthase-like GNAT family acetyltransferase
MSIHDPSVLPEGLAAPVDDGLALHVMHAALPAVELTATNGKRVRLNDAGAIGDRAVLFFYPRTGVPGQPPSLGFAGETWESIPGARGCTPQSCGFRDLAGEFAKLGVKVWGLSTNTVEHQEEFKQRSGISFDFLSDAELALTRAMNLPTFKFPVESGGPDELIRRMAWYVERDAAGSMRVRKVWYPVFPPDENAKAVYAWLRRRGEIEVRSIQGWGSLSQDAAAFARDELIRNWHATAIWSRGVTFHADRLHTFVARRGGEWAGHVTLAFEKDGADAGCCEVITLAAKESAGGVGSRLLEAAEDEARLRGCERVYLTTTNDNLRAIEFYQKRGWRLAALHKASMDRCREAGKHVPMLGLNGIPLRDELELELGLKGGK